jgi:DnaJ-class molecular chaperone
VLPQAILEQAELVSFSDEQIAELKHAYQVLGVPLSATPVAIKWSYRSMVKRWHPDLYPSGTEEYIEATRMTRTANESYALIRDAPLRYYFQAFHPDYVDARPRVRDPGYPKVDSIFKFSWFEFWLRFGAGAIWGALFGFRFGLRFYAGVFSVSDPDKAFFACIIVWAIVWAFIVALAGDKFWHKFFGSWWVWR